MEQTVSASQDDNWQFVLNELQRIDNLRSSVVGMSIEVNDLKKEVQLVKKIQGIDQDVKSQDVKDDNVIGKDKLPTILTAVQKKRYESIGIEFVKGAGKQFERIKKAVQFKQKMKTQNDKMVEQVKKNGQRIKKQVKKHSFWKKLFAVIAIIGAVALLFKDKIAKLLPDLSGGMNNIGSNLLTFFKGLLINLSTKAVSLISTGISNIIKTVCVGIMPGIVDGFFNNTLPLTMVATTLTLMSMFSDSAGQQLDKLIGASSDENADYVRGIGQAHLKNEQQKFQVLDMSIEQLQQSSRGLELARRDYARALYNNQQKGWGANDQARAIIAGIDAAIGGYNLDQLIRDGKIPLTNLLQQLNEARGITDIETRKQKYIEIINGALQQFGGLSSDDTTALTSHLNSIITADSDLIAALVGRMVNFQNGNVVTYNALTGAIRKAQEQSFNATISPQLQNAQQPITFVSHINVEQALMSKFGEGITSLLSSIDNFLNGSASNESFINAVNGYFKTLGDSCNTYITNNVKSLSEAITGLKEKVTDFGNIGLGQKMFQLIRGINVANSNENQPNEQSYSYFDGRCVAIINVKINDLYTTQLGNALTEMKTNTTEIINSVNTSIQNLQKINTLLNQQIIINTPHTTGDMNFEASIRATLVPFDARLNEHNTRLQKLQNPQPQSSEANDSSNTTFS